MSIRITNIILLFFYFQGIALIITVLQIVQIPNLKVSVFTLQLLIFLVLNMNLLYSSDPFCK